jgi:HPt (histidine-containing phosphotransfer) domain-containing protein
VDARAGLDPPAGAAIDLAAYRRVEDTMGADMPLLVVEFLTSTERLIDDMARGARDNDPTTVRRRAHTLRSSAASLGALYLSSLAAELDTELTAATAVDGAAAVAAVAAVAKLYVEFARVRAALQRIEPVAPASP